MQTINGKEVTEEEIQAANEEYRSLSDLILWSLPDMLLQPLLARLRLDGHESIGQQRAKKWLMSADPALRSVVTKEALQWKKSAVNQVGGCSNMFLFEIVKLIVSGRCGAEAEGEDLYWRSFGRNVQYGEETEAFGRTLADDFAGNREQHTRGLFSVGSVHERED